MSTDTKKLAERLNRLIQEGQTDIPVAFEEWRESARMTLRSIYGEGDAVLERFDSIRYRPAASYSGMSNSVFDKAAKAGISRAVAVLTAALEDIETRDPEPPHPSVSGLHPWVSGVAATLWDNGHRREAVREAARNVVEVQLKAKLGTTGTATQLVTSAFSPQPPKSGQPRLRFNQFKPDTESWTNAHEGAMLFGQGCVRRIRNLETHEDLNLSEQETLESLVAFSLLARWVDEADIEEVS